MTGFVVTIDGPAGSGKSTISREVASRLGAVFLDTGAMYRAMTLMAMQRNIPLDNAAVIKQEFSKTKFHFEPADGKMIVTIDDHDCCEAIRTPEVTANVHYIANEPQLRELLVTLQRQFAAEQKKVVTEGRDQGTVVFPDAEVKIFLVANVEERAKRRYLELTQKGTSCDINEIKEAIAKRDAGDQARKVGGLKKADDAIELDTSDLTIEEVVEKALEIVREKL